MMHNNLIAGYFATKIIYNKIKKRYYWLKIYEDIKIYVKSYKQYQKKRKSRNKNELYNIKTKKKNELYNIKAIKLFYQIGIDIIGLLSITSRRKKYIIIAIDYFTK